MSEPSVEVYHGQTPGNVLLTYVNATRPAFLSASVLSVFTALAFAWSLMGSLDYFLAILTVLSVAFFHSGANVLNDYFDSKNGTDEINTNRIFPFSGGSRFIQNGVLSEQKTLFFGSMLILSGIALGLIIVSISGPVILIIGLIGAILSVFYSAPPCLACKGLGDVTIATCFGLLPVIGTVYTQTGYIAIESVWMGFSLGCFVAAILWINSIPDIEADREAGKNTWPSRLEKKSASWMHAGWFIAGFSLIALTPLTDIGYIVFLAVIPATIAVASVINGKLIPAIPLTILTHAALCLLLIINFVLG